MKRTKTFVMKFLSVIVLGAVVLSSCTKDLEDRMDKVEESLTTVIKDIASLKSELEAMKNEPKATVSADMDAATGKVTLKFTNPDKTIVFDGKNDGNDKAVVTVEENKPTENYTTVTVDGKSFVFPTSLPEIPTNVTGIVSIETLAIAYEGATFTVNYFFNTDGNAPIDAKITAANFEVLQSKTRASSSLEKSAMKIVEIEQVGTTNEYQFTFEAGSLAAGQNSNDELMFIRLKDNTAILSGFTMVDISPIPAVTNITIDSKTAANTAPTLDPIVVNVVDNDFTNITKDVKIGLANAGGVLPYALYKDFSVKLYAYETTALANYFVVSAANLDTQAAALKSWMETAANKVVDATEFITITKDSVITIDATAVAKTIENYGSKTYMLVVNGKTVSTNGKYFAAAANLTITKQQGVTMDEQLVKYTAETAANQVVDFSATYKDKTYKELTGSDIYSNTLAVRVLDKEGKEVAGAATVTGKLDAQAYLTYTVELNKSVLPTGVYSVVVTLTDDGNLYDFIQEVTYARPEITVGIKETPADFYTMDGKNAIYSSYKKVIKADGTYNSTAATTDNLNKIDLTKSFVGKSSIDGVVAGTNYKVGYILYTLDADGKKVFVAGQSETFGTTDAYKSLVFANIAPVTAFDVAFKPAGADNKIEFNKEYYVDAVVVFAGGTKFNAYIETGYTIKSQTVKTEGFLSQAGPNGVFSEKLSREITFASTTDKIDLSYIQDEPKPFFFGNADKSTAIVTDELKPVHSHNYVIAAADGIVYEVMPVKFKDVKTSINVATGQTITDDTDLTFIQFATVVAAKPTFVEIRTNPNNKAYLSYVAATDVDGLKAPITQTVKATITDIWGIETERMIEVTIKPAPVVVP